MKKIIILFITLFCAIGYCVADDVIERQIQVQEKPCSAVYVNNKLTEKLIVLSIAVDDFSSFPHLHSSDNLSELNYACEKVLVKSYSQVTSFLRSKSVSKSKIEKTVQEVVERADANTTVLVILASHGTICDGDYYLIASDTEKDKIQASAIKGSWFCNQFEQMTSNGARVVVFIDTCHGEALYKNSRTSDDVIYFASTNENETSKEFSGWHSILSDNLAYILVSKNRDVRRGDKIDIYSIALALQTAIEQGGQKTQTFCSFPDLETLKDRSFPVMRYIEDMPMVDVNAFVPWSVSTDRRGLDVALVSVEVASLLSMITCGVMTTSYRCKINEMETDYGAQKYRKYGRNAATGFWISTGALVASYIGRFVSVQCEYHSNKTKVHPGKFVYSMYFNPYIDSEHLGLSLSINF